MPSTSARSEGDGDGRRQEKGLELKASDDMGPMLNRLKLTAIRDQLDTLLGQRAVPDVADNMQIKIYRIEPCFVRRREVARHPA